MTHISSLEVAGPARLASLSDLGQEEFIEPLETIRRAGERIASSEDSSPLLGRLA